VSLKKEAEVPLRFSSLINVADALIIPVLLQTPIVSLTA
jgi:hypothetical protein